MAEGHEAPKVRIVVIDDHPMLRAGITSILNRERDFTVLAEGGTAAEAIRLVEQLQPDVLLLDLSLPGGGLAALQRIAHQWPAVSVLIVTVRGDEQTLSTSMRSGARGYALKGISAEELVSAVRLVHQGKLYVTPAFAIRPPHTADSGHATAGTAPAPEFTAREEAILRLLAKGLSNHAISTQLSLSQSTVKRTMGSIRRKLRVSNRIEAAMVAAAIRGVTS